jgi:hypothetical protein
MSHLNQFKLSTRSKEKSVKLYGFICLSATVLGKGLSRGGFARQLPACIIIVGLNRMSIIFNSLQASMATIIFYGMPVAMLDFY